MNRRNFLKSVAALGVTPLLPGNLIATAIAAPSAATKATIPSASYMWAETIVRAHNQCTLGMLQRHLKLDFDTAVSVQTELIKNGVINIHANEFGIRTATKPLFRGAFVQNSNPPALSADNSSRFSEQVCIEDTRDEVSEEDPASIEIDMPFDESDVVMVTSADVVAIAEENRIHFAA